MKQTFADAVANHRKLWYGIADHIKKNGLTTDNVTLIKRTVRDELFPELKTEYIRGNCFLCDFVTSQTNTQTCDCGMCPLVREDPEECLDYLFVYFCRVVHDHNRGAAIQFAMRIAKLPIINPLYIEDGDKI